MTRRLLTPTLQISIGLLSLTISLILIAFSFGLYPDEDKAALEARAKISENLAVQLASLAARNDSSAIGDTITSIVGRGGDVLSIALRNAGGKLLVGSDQHTARWIEPADGRSTATHVRVPLMNGDVPEGRIELIFRPLNIGKTIFGVSRMMIGFVGFIAVAGFAGYHFILRRSLRELDPGRAIPERVKAAFDTLAEGVLIMDEQEFVVMANDAFFKKIYTGSKPLLGARVGNLPWDQSGTAAARECPWQTALRSANPVVGVPMSIASHSGETHRLMVNATRIVGANGTVHGVIATFDDVTLLQKTNEQLNLSIDRLHLSQMKISEQNKQLQILASSDPLTGCLNRRTFFAEAERMLETSRSQRQPMSFVMLDVDHFKSINDRFGHVVGDEVLIGLVDLLKRICPATELLGRYGGEEFCIAVAGVSEPDVEKLAEHCRRAVSEVTTWLPNAGRVTISLGIASLAGAQCNIADLVKRADEALYAAKTSGRNRLVNWASLQGEPGAPLARRA